MWVERRRGRSEGSLGWCIGLLGVGGGESEKMSERGLVVGEGGREGGVEGGVEDILII